MIYHSEILPFRANAAFVWPYNEWVVPVKRHSFDIWLERLSNGVKLDFILSIEGTHGV